MLVVGRQEVAACSERPYEGCGIRPAIGYISGEVRELRDRGLPLLQGAGLASAKLARIVAIDWLLHTLRWPISRMFSAVPSRALPVDDRALSDERMREAA
ncbi:hypothetical protein QNA19_23630 [Rhodococcus fascians]|uniref:hypothetical protein n=1 Tax=Rhodococcoides fascians TaxID=1828 RepID=UPI0024B88C5F|nr:hypothetical protein [Rhodococcus fascians]MDJ0428934.1 hypothetical protein [Rhodococcus fascians]